MFTPTNPLVGPLLTDKYQLTMAYAYWKSGMHEDPAVFDLLFRKNPFGGEFGIFAGLEEVLRLLNTFRFSDDDITYIHSLIPNAEDGFFKWLRGADCSGIKVYAPREGTIMFPRVPLVRVEGPLAIAQLLETPFLNLVNFPSLITTNAARFRLAAGWDKKLLEFGLRRAQGPDGGISATRYSYIGGFDGTSNVMGNKLFGIPVQGTHAHSFVSSFMGLEDLKNRTLVGPDGTACNFVEVVLVAREELGFTNTNEGELAAFIAYAQAFPRAFLALVDTYDTLKSGVPNFLSVALALQRIGYQPVGVRLDSGDLAYLSKETRKMFCAVTQADFSHLLIAASNDINEPVLHALREQGHEIDTFGIGTHLVTCEAQPAMGCVYKLVAIRGIPRIKLSEQPEKITIPGSKDAYRLLDAQGIPILDLMVQTGVNAPKAGDRILCLDPFNEMKRVYVVPNSVLPLYQCVWNGKVMQNMPSIHAIRNYCIEQLHSIRVDHLRAVNPTPYKVSVSSALYDFIHELWMQEAPIPEIR